MSLRGQEDSLGCDVMKNYGRWRKGPGTPPPEGTLEGVEGRGWLFIQSSRRGWEYGQAFESALRR